MRHPACLAPAQALMGATVKGMLLLSVALVALHAGASAAKPAHAAAPAPADDGLGKRDVYVEADDMVDDRNTNLVTATGHVELRYQGRTLRADKVIYNSVNGAVHAIGHIVIVNEDGTVEYASEAQLDDQFRAGVALGFSARLQDNVTIVANAAIRRAETVNDLHRARYTPCAICNANGSAKEPSWSIEAAEIVEDRDRQVIYYRHAVIRVLGVPVLYLPLFWHPDPTAARSSGFLTPKIGYSNRRGLSYEQPYLWAISPYADLRISPQFNTNVNPLLNLHYRERFFSGDLDIRAGYTYSQLFDNHTKFGDDTNRSYILAKGKFDLDPKWTVGFGLERVTDPTFLRRYGVPGVFQDRGLYATDTDRLISQAYVKRQDRQSFVQAGVLSFESLRASVVDLQTGAAPTIQRSDTSSAFPIATPLEARFNPDQLLLGGRLRFDGSAVTLTRNNAVVDITDPTGLFPAGPEPFNGSQQKGVSSLTYRDSRRISGQVEWRRDFTLMNGLRISPFAETHGDAYSINQGLIATGAVNAATGAVLTSKAQGSIARASGTVGTDISWPFIKPISGGSVILEPIAQIAISPKVRLNPNIPNEDSASFEFDETNLFSIHRFPGQDLDEGGQRLNVGGRATVDWGSGRSGSLMIGRAFTTQVNPIFTATSGLQRTASDWVTAATLTPIQGISVFNRARLDADTWKVHREEFGINAQYGPVSATIRYHYDENGLVQVQCQTVQCLSPFGGFVVNGATVIGKVQNADIGGTYNITKNWGVTANVTRDLQTRIWPAAQLGAFYQDDCVRIDLVYTHDETFAATIGTSDSIVVRLTLATLGITLAPGQKSNDSR